MAPSRIPDIDVLINDALAGEPLRPVPPGLCRGFERRLHYAALLKQERKVYWRRLALGLGLVPALAAAAAWLVWRLDLFESLARSGPGELGRWDYLAVTAARSSWALLGSASVLAAASGALALLWLLSPARK